MGTVSIGGKDIICLGEKAEKWVKTLCHDKLFHFWDRKGNLQEVLSRYENFLVRKVFEDVIYLELLLCN